MKSLLGKLGVILIGLTIFGYAEVWGADWKLFFEVKADEWPSSKHYYDTESIVKTPQGYIRVWWKTISETSKDDTMFDVKNLIEINCPLREYRHLRITRYYGNGRIEEEGPQEKWDYISPDGSLENLYKVICGNVKK
jgi:hypothetical protein